jgi:hypothetical protein
MGVSGITRSYREGIWSRVAVSGITRPGRARGDAGSGVTDRVAMRGPSDHPDFTQEVAPNESQGTPKAMTREALIYEALFGARWLSP